MRGSRGSPYRLEFDRQNPTETRSDATAERPQGTDDEALHNRARIRCAHRAAYSDCFEPNDTLAASHWDVRPPPSVCLLLSVWPAFARSTTLRRMIGWLRIQREREAAFERLVRYAQLGRPFKIFIRTRGSQEWLRASRVDSRGITVESGEYHAMDAVRAHVVAYPSGELVEQSGGTDMLPDGVRSIDVRDEPLKPIAPDDDLLNEGRRDLRVTFAVSSIRPREPSYCTTYVMNASDEPIQVVRFGAYIRDGALFRLSTVSGDYFSGSQFREWYGANGGWIAPGETVFDPINYSAPGTLWVYFGETQGGRSFASGARADTTRDESPR